MTSFTTRRRRRLLIPIIHLIARIYHAYRVCTIQLRPIRIPYQSRSSRARVTVARPRSTFFTATTLATQKFYIIKLLSSPPWVLFACNAVYDVLSELSFLSYLYQYLLRYPGFSYYSLRFLNPLFFIVLEVAFSGNNANFCFGLCFTLVLICVIN